jgi:copper chaperone NosL
MKEIIFLSTFVLSSVLATGLTSAAAQEKKEEPRCAVCDMRILEKNRNFSVVMPKVPGMDPSAFDDAGCAVIWRNKECASRQSTFDSNAYTFDYETGGQVPVDKAFFVAEAGVWTPMGYEIIAFKEKAKAEAFIAGKGKGQLLKWYQVVDLPIK